ncbi:hypothetical protein QUB37_05765 [Microcoleus sp. AT3-A2]|uniref:hypothetical protein n=1 Tax=unclassified Microcoleus TaxID=2642155 RepID=UPI002FD72E25
MSSNQNNNVVHNTWFLTNIDYEGEGRAEFENPKGYIEGLVKVSFDEFGNSSIEMNVANCYTEQPLRVGFIEFFNADTPIEEEGRFSFTNRLGSNPCKSLTVNTPDGIYSAQGSIVYQPSIALGGDNTRVEFYLVPSYFDNINAEIPKYWVFPIFNLISDFTQLNSQLDCHPLRILPRLDDAENTTWTPLFRKLFFNIHRLIVFDFKGTKGFIQKLLDFKERKKKLYSGQVQRTITAVMVGEVGSESIDIDKLTNWLPFGLLPLLSLATGSEVGIPWIEFRDANGGLVRRIHKRFGQPKFSRGHTTISEQYNQGTGYLLTGAQSSTPYGKEPLGSVIFDLVQSSSHSLTIEDKLNKICRAFDYLCQHYKLDTQNLLLGLDDDYKEFVKKTLKSAAQDIRSVGQAASDSGQSKLLNKIADKTINSSNIDRDFGLAVTDLLKHLGLHDADIIDAYYQSNPRADGRTHWSSVMSRYRGIAVHTGDFSFQEKTYDIHDVVRITYHLYDILVRIVFKMLGYDGTYQPIIRNQTSQPVDWVKADLQASELGY